MGIFSSLFGGNQGKGNRSQPVQSLTGGDGTSLGSAVVVNCAGMSMANRLIDRFISERHGEKDSDWERGAEFFETRYANDPTRVRVVTALLADGGNKQYWFDVTEPMAGSMAVLDRMGILPKE